MSLNHYHDYPNPMKPGAPLLVLTGGKGAYPGAASLSTDPLPVSA